MRGLQVAQRGERLETRYLIPRLTTEGARLGVLDIELQRATGAGDFDKVAERRRRRVAPGESLVDAEPLPAPGTVVRVAARAIADGHASTRTTIVTFTTYPPPVAPRDLSVELGTQGVRLSWEGPVPTPVATPSPSPSPSGRPASPPPVSPPTGATPSPPVSPPPGATASPPVSPSTEGSPQASPSPSAPPSPAPKPRPSGFWIYRRASEGAFGAPLNAAAPIESPPYVDATAVPGQSFCYAVTAVASTDPVVESAASDEACLEVKDVIAPAAPLGVAALVSDEAVEVSWSPSSEADLVSYRVYRARAGQHPELRGEVAAPETRFRDQPLATGEGYVYTVTAVDQAGNESAPSAPARASAR